MSRRRSLHCDGSIRICNDHAARQSTEFRRRPAIPLESARAAAEEFFESQYVAALIAPMMDLPVCTMVRLPGREERSGLKTSIYDRSCRFMLAKRMTIAPGVP
jgi:hypothetical protein